MKIAVDITPELCYDHGLHADSSMNCPIAVAMRRRGFAIVWPGVQYTGITLEPGRLFTFPREVVDWQKRWDCCDTLPIPPIQFELDIDDRDVWLRPDRLVSHEVKA